MVNSIHIDDPVTNTVDNTYFISGYINIFKAVPKNTDNSLLNQKRIFSGQLHGINPLF